MFTDFLCHLLRIWWVNKYSLIHLFQKCWVRNWTSIHRFNGVAWESFTTLSGRAVRGPPMRKCPGVTTCESCGSVLIIVIGLELRTASIWVSKVVSSSKLSRILPICLLRSCLTLFTPAFHKPPKWGARGGIITHCTPWLAIDLFSELCLSHWSICWISCISLRDPMKFVALSL